MQHDQLLRPSSIQHNMYILLCTYYEKFTSIQHNMYIFHSSIQREFVFTCYLNYNKSSKTRSAAPYRFSVLFIFILLFIVLFITRAAWPAPVLLVHPARYIYMYICIYVCTHTHTHTHKHTYYVYMMHICIHNMYMLICTYYVHIHALYAHICT